MRASCWCSCVVATIPPMCWCRRAATSTTPRPRPPPSPRRWHRAPRPTRPPFDARQPRVLAQMYRGARFESLINEGFELRQTVAQEAEAMQRRNSMMAANLPAQAEPDMAGRMQEMQAANRRALSAKGFEVEARRMAGLMRERFNLGFIDVGGWDTHVNQGGAQGQLANLLDNLGRGISGFADEIGPVWSKTTVVVVSEF